MSSDRDRSSGGAFTTEISLDRVLGVFETVDSPIITSRMVKDELECSQESARSKLIRLHDQGRVGRRKVGQTNVFWRTKSPESRLKQLSEELNERIIVGDSIYEHGEQFPRDPDGDTEETQ